MLYINLKVVMRSIAYCCKIGGLYLILIFKWVHIYCESLTIENFTLIIIVVILANPMEVKKGQMPPLGWSFLLKMGYVIKLDSKSSFYSQLGGRFDDQQMSGSYSTSISACGVSESRAGVQVSKREFYTHIHLD